MKKTILLFFISTFMSFSQSIEFEKIVQVDSTETKEILFNRLNSRLIEFFGGQEKYNKNIIQSDSSLGIIKFSQVINYDPKGNRSADGQLTFTTSIYFKDGRYKIIFSDFYHEGKGISLYQITKDEEYPHEKSNFLNFRKKAWKELKHFINEEIPKKFNVIQSLINSQTEIEKDW